MVSITLHSCMRAIYSQSSFQAVASQKGLTCVRRVATSLPQLHIQTHLSLGPAIPRRYVSSTSTCPSLLLLSAVWSLDAVVVSSLLVADLLLQCGRRSGTRGCRKSYKWVRRPHPCFLSRHRISSSLRRQVKEMLRISGKILAFGLRQQPRCRLGWSHHQPKYYLLLDRPAHVHGSHELCQASQVK